MYLIYDCVKNSPFSIATQNVLKQLDIPFATLEREKAFKVHGGHFGRIGVLESFFFANLYNLALAVNAQKVLLAFEEDSYANMMYAIKMIQNNQALKDFVTKELINHNITLDFDSLEQHIAYFPAILENHLEKIQQNIKYSFAVDKDSNEMAMPLIMPRSVATTGFSTCIFYSSRHADCNMRQEYKNLHQIFKLVGLHLLETPNSTQSFTHLLTINAEKAYERSGELLFSGIDLGVDFLCVCAESTFNMFDRQQNSCIKYCRRDPVNIASLNIAQILLVAFGKEQEARFDLHTIKPQFNFHSTVK